MPSFNSSRRRHTKHSSLSNKPDAPPALALNSRHSSGSTSNAQSTPRSIFQAGLRSSKLPTSEIKSVRRDECIEPKGIELSSRGNVDVFAFMEKEDDSWDNATREQDAEAQDLSEQDESPRILTARRAEPPQMSPRYSDLEVRAIQDGVQRAWGRASLHSDSGISMHSGSPDPESPILQHKYSMIEEVVPDALEATIEDDESQMAELCDSPDPTIDQRISTHKHWPSLKSNQDNVPEAGRAPPQGPSIKDSPARQLHIPEMASRPTQALVHRKPCPSRSAPSQKKGYDCLASNINSRDDALLRPIYRKFETLNNRMLLYLQDEISEIEDQLRELDAAIAQEDSDLERGPESRRSEAKLPSQLQWHRLDLLGRSFAKVDQYNRALTSYSNLVKSLDPASQRDIKIYKEWIAQHVPVSREETRFLQTEADLVAVTPPHNPSQPQAYQGAQLDFPIIVLAFAFVSTIIVFRVVPQILARLVISAMVGIASLCTLSPSMSMSLEGLRDWKQGITMYVARPRRADRRH
ncbi:MAG: hypothetical protein Q9217_000440 [Psora testacea]